MTGGQRIEPPESAATPAPRRQVSEIGNLRGKDTDRGLQIEEGIPPEDAARQEAQGPPDESEGNAVRSTPRRNDV